MATEIKKIISRRDTAAKWEANNPILAQGEIGVDTTNKVMKIGDGVTPWKSLKGVGGTEIVNNLTTGGADKALSAEMGKELDGKLAELGEQINGVKDVEIDLSLIPSSKDFFIDSDKWASIDDTYKASLIEVNEGEVYEITANSTRYANFSCIAEQDIINGNNVIFSGDYTGKRNIAVDTTKTITIPSGTKWLYLERLYYNINNTPSKIILKRQSSVESITQRIVNLEERTENTSIQIDDLVNANDDRFGLVYDASMSKTTNSALIVTLATIKLVADKTYKINIDSFTNSVVCYVGFYEPTGYKQIYHKRYEIGEGQKDEVLYTPKQDYENVRVAVYVTSAGSFDIDAKVVVDGAFSHAISDIEELKKYSDNLKGKAIDLTKQVTTTSSDIRTLANIDLMRNKKYIINVDSFSNTRTAYIGFWQATGYQQLKYILFESGTSHNGVIEYVPVEDYLNARIAVYATGEGTYDIVATLYEIGELASYENEIIPKDGIPQSDKDNLECLANTSHYAGKPFNFIHMSDTHTTVGYTKALDNIVSFSKMAYIDCLVHTGDIIYDNFPDELDSFKNTIVSLDKPLLMCVGNHDVGETKVIANSGSDEQVYNKFYAPFSNVNQHHDNINGCSYFVDFDTYRIRFISIYTFNHDMTPDTNDTTMLKYTRSSYCFRQAQIDWLISVLKSTPEGYVVFPITHYYERLGEKTDDWQCIRMVHSGLDDFLTEIFTAFKERSNIKISREQVAVNENIRVEADFSDAKAYFGAWLNGHSHDDFVGLSENGKLNIINKCCDNLHYQSGCSLHKKLGSVTENSINVVSVDTEYRTISIFRIGAKYSRNGDYRNVKRLTY